MRYYKVIDKSYPWETWRCRGRNKDGSRCHNSIRRGYIRENGEIVVYFTCIKHADQETKIRDSM